MRLLIILILMIASASPAQILKLTEADLPKLIETRNNRALSAKDHVAAADKLTGHLARSYFPKVEARVGTERFKTGTYQTDTQPFGGIGATLNVFNSGKDRLEERVRKEQVHSAEIRSSQTMRDELKQARKVLWTLIAQKELQALIEEALKANTKNLSAANTRIRAGSATDTDRLEFEMYRTELEQDQARLKLSVQSLQRELGTKLNIDSATIETATAVGHDHEDSILSATINALEHPDVSSLSNQANIAGYRRAQARRAWLPKLDLFAHQTLYTFREREYSEQANRWDTVFGLQFSAELFDGGNAFAMGSSYAAEAVGLEREASQKKAELANQIETAKAELKLTHELVHDSEETLQRSSRYFSRSMDEYRRGVKNSLDVLNVSQRTLSVRRRYVEIRRDYQLARADLLAALGR